MTSLLDFSGDYMIKSVIEGNYVEVFQLLQMDGCIDDTIPYTKDIDDITITDPVPSVYCVILNRSVILSLILNALPPAADGGDDDTIFEGSSLLYLAMHFSSFDCVKVICSILGDRAMINLPSAKTGLCPLTVAIEHESADEVRYLLERGADLFLVQNGRGTPMDIAKERNNADVLREIKHYAAVHNTRVLRRLAGDGAAASGDNDEEEEEEEEEMTCRQCDSRNLRMCFICGDYFCPFHVRKHRHANIAAGQY